MLPTLKNASLKVAVLSDKQSNETLPRLGNWEVSNAVVIYKQESSSYIQIDGSSSGLAEEVTIRKGI